MSGKLEKATCYLSGPIEFAPDGGVQWRREFIRLTLEAGLKLYYIDPTNKPGGHNIPMMEDKSHQEKLQKEGRWQEMRDYVANYRAYDLRAVDASDFMIFLIDPTIPQWGTANEVYEAEREHKPSFFICEGGLYNLPRWLFDVVDLEEDGLRCNVFETVEQVVQELVGYNDGTYPMGREWILFRKRLEEISREHFKASKE